MKILVKNTLLFLLLFAGGYPLGQCAILGITDSPWYFLLCVPFLYVAKSASMPFLCGIGVFRYHSPMLLSVMNSSKKVIELHSGGIVDMIPIARLEDAGFHWRRKTFAYFLEGLLNLIKELKANGADGYRIEGTSYFFNSRTLEKLGFSMAEPSLWQRAKILVFSPELMLIYSFAQGRLSLPPVTRVKKAIAESTALIEHEDSIKQLYEKLNPRQEGEKANQSVQRTS